MLHIINTLVGHKALFARFAKGDSLLFVDEAVLSLHAHSETAKALLAYTADFQYYVLEADLCARGLSAKDILTMINLVDYVGFVNLTIEHAVIKTWN
ncbi:MAG: sulfurtransferase complex subunit TusB [Methyloprofundus sp.]|nr:sulfurtransferase complex subunit TusB [Methyloprofundus sp.]